MLELALKLWGGLIAALTFLGFIFTVFDIYQTRTELLRWWKQRRELNESYKSLARTNEFVAHVIHVGGEFSMIHSLTVRVDTDGGWYLNPPRRFISVSWNRGGDLMLVGTTEFTRKQGRFLAREYRSHDGAVTQLQGDDFCGVPITAMRNAYEVLFVREHPLDL